MLKIATWNVNSVRVRLQTVLSWMEHAQPDVLCLQETKVTDELFPAAPFEALGYSVTVSGQKTYNGVAILSKYNLTSVITTFPDWDAQWQKRLVAATIGQLRLINVYVPHGAGPGSEKFAYKLEFIGRVRHYLEQLHDPEEPLILAGDFNVAPEPRDVYDAEAMEGEICFHPEERAALEELRNWGFRDVFRQHHNESGLYSWWDYRAGAFRRNMGLRIDHIWASFSLAALCLTSGMDKAQRSLPKPSDHIPVWATFDLRALHAQHGA
jgi:exodeoxyribonuclease-3